MVNKVSCLLLLSYCIDYCHDEGDISIIRDAFLHDLDNNETNANIFVASLEKVRKDLKKDLDFFLDSDPACFSKEEVILAYPGYKAITYYRIAHELNRLGYHLPARIITEEAHTLTGIDIHPGAEIASPFFIDHGTGVVIGETSIIKEKVKIYQGTTLGAISLAKGSKLRGIKRHPTIEKNVTIYAGASILGDVTIGENVTIGSNVFLMEDVEPNTKVSIGKIKLIKKSKTK